MAVIYGGGRGGGVLGTLSTLAGLGGALIPGAGWLSALGTGLGAANNMMNGNPQGISDVLGQLASEGLGGWTNPAAGNISRSPTDAALEPWWNEFQKQQMRRQGGW